MKLIDTSLQLNGFKVSGFVYRGDPSAYDKTVSDFTADATWRDLDLSAILPAGTVAAIITCKVSNSVANEYISFKRKGDVNNYNVTTCQTFVTNVVIPFNSFFQAVDENRYIQYKASNGGAWATINFIVNGYFVSY
jgi:hypothetical protein